MNPEQLYFFRDEIEKYALSESYYRPNEYDNQYALPGIARRHGDEAAHRVRRAHRDRDALLTLNLMKIHGGKAPKTPHKALGDSASWDKAVTDRAIDGLPSFTPEERAGLRQTLETKRQGYADKADKASFLTKWYHKGNANALRDILDAQAS
jgi:hypothetical protein